MLTKLILGLIGVVVVFAAYVRLMPSDAGRWHVAPDQEPREFDGGLVIERVLAAAPMDVLDRLDTIARAAPRTKVLGGSVDEALITYVTRSKFWGFPDYTTVAVVLDADDNTVLTIHARLRFGRSDLGVNRKRVKSWLGALEQSLAQAR